MAMSVRSLAVCHMTAHSRPLLPLFLTRETLSLALPGNSKDSWLFYFPSSSKFFLFLVWLSFKAYWLGCQILFIYIYIYQMYMIWLGWILWHINHCRLFNVKSSLYIHIKYIWFDFVVFYGISTLVGYLMVNPLYTYIWNIY